MPLKRITISDEHGEAISEKVNMELEMTIDAVHHNAKFNTTVLFSGVSDFLALITYLNGAGKQALIFSSKNNRSFYPLASISNNR